jgi:hypothetical protein
VGEFAALDVISMKGMKAYVYMFFHSGGGRESWPILRKAMVKVYRQCFGIQVLELILLGPG